MNDLKEIETEIALLDLKNDILHITIKEDTEIDIDNIKENIKCREKVQQGKKFLVFVDTTGLHGISNEARSYAAQDEITSMNKAMAVLTPSLPTKMLVNFFIKFDKPNSPTKMFNTRQKALDWLETYR